MDASPAHLPAWLAGPLQQNILSRSRRAVESDSRGTTGEPMVSDMIQQQLTDICFQEIGTRVDLISPKSLFHHDKTETYCFQGSRKIIQFHIYKDFQK